MLKCTVHISDEALSAAVLSVLGLCGIACQDDGDSILVTDSPDADVLPYRGCVMLARNVNTAAESPKTRVLTLPLAYDELIEAVRSFEAGEAETKPISADIEQTEARCDVLCHDGCVSFGEKSVQLTEREMMLFELMASRPGEIVTREEIRSCVWRENDGTTNVADVYISYLRKKLIPLFGRGVIITVRGQGYMLVLP